MVLDPLTLVLTVLALYGLLLLIGLQHVTISRIFGFLLARPVFLLGEATAAVGAQRAALAGRIARLRAQEGVEEDRALLQRALALPIYAGAALVALATDLELVQQYFGVETPFLSEAMTAVGIQPDHLVAASVFASVVLLGLLIFDLVRGLHTMHHPRNPDYRIAIWLLVGLLAVLVVLVAAAMGWQRGIWLTKPVPEAASLTTLASADPAEDAWSLEDASSTEGEPGYVTEAMTPEEARVARTVMLLHAPMMVITGMLAFHGLFGLAALLGLAAYRMLWIVMGVAEAVLRLTHRLVEVLSGALLHAVEFVLLTARMMAAPLARRIGTDYTQTHLPVPAASRAPADDPPSGAAWPADDPPPPAPAGAGEAPEPPSRSGSSANWNPYP